MQKTRVLLTGATGFLGSHVLDALRVCDEIDVIVACRDSSKLPSDFSGEIRAGDLRHSSYVKQLVTGVDVICHCAAWTSMWAHRKQEQEYYRDPSIALSEAALAAGVKRFIFPSSPVATSPRRDGTAVPDGEHAQHPRFWPHLDTVVDLEHHLQQQSRRGMQVVILRLGHFVGKRYKLGFLSLLLPRLKTHLVPWIDHGRARVPLTDGRDLAKGFLLAITATELQAYECFNICGPDFPSMREVIDFLHREIGIPTPHYYVSRAVAYQFARLMEALCPLHPGDPFLTRSIVLLAEDWYAPSNLARERLGYIPQYHWQEAVKYQLQDMKTKGYAKTPMVDVV